MLTTLQEAASPVGQGAAQLRTGVWYGDEPLILRLPPEWNVTVHWPQTPPPLTDDQIAASLENPVGQPPVRELCRGKTRPLVIVDDLSRPTPAYRVLPFLLKQFELAGIPARAVRVLISTGTHSAPSKGGAVKKVGWATGSECEVIIHDCTRNLVETGRTFLGALVSVNKEVTASDFVIGIGGVYPNQTAGFGGGSTLALGVLGFHSIKHLHYRNESVGWGSSSTTDSMRRDLDEIARMIHLRTVISTHIDPMREVIRLTCGDPFLLYPGEVEFARKTFAAPPPKDADIVICNAYPGDVSLTSVHMKALAPLEYCAPHASRIVVASCPEGIGHHGLFPLIHPHPRLHRLQHIARRFAAMNAPDLWRKIIARDRAQSVHKNPIRLYRPGNHRFDLPAESAEFHISSFWTEIVQAVRSEHPHSHYLRAVLYPCAPLQVLS